MSERRQNYTTVPRVVMLALAGTLTLSGASCQASVGSAPEGSDPTVTTNASDPGAPEILMTTEQVRASLGSLAVKGRAPKTGYNRDAFGVAWSTRVDGCDTRNRILQRDLRAERTDKDGCKVLEGTLHSAYSGNDVHFVRGEDSDDVQIDHVVALSNAWQTGAQQWDETKRVAFANDTSNLEAVEGPLNQQKGDADAATWVPPDKSYRCVYVARQIMTKDEYGLWVTPPEHDAMASILDTCRDQTMSVPNG